MDCNEDIWGVGPTKGYFEGDRLPTARAVLQVLEFHYRKMSETRNDAVKVRQSAQKLVARLLTEAWRNEPCELKLMSIIVIQLKKLSFQWRDLYRDRFHKSPEAIQERLKFQDLIDQLFNISKVANYTQQTSAAVNKPQMKKNLVIKKQDPGKKNKLGISTERKMLRNLWVSGLGPQTSGYDLKDAFMFHGTVLGAQVIKRTSEPEPNTYGRVTMATNQMAAKCIAKLNGTDLLGHRIKVERISLENLKGGVQQNHDEKQFGSTVHEEHAEQERDVPKNQGRPNSNLNTWGSRDREHNRPDQSMRSRRSGSVELDNIKRERSVVDRGNKDRGDTFNRNRSRERSMRNREESYFRDRKMHASSSDWSYQRGNRSRDRGDEDRRFGQSGELQDTQMNLLDEERRFREEEERLKREREELARERAHILQEQAELQRFEIERRAKIEEERNELLRQQRKIEEAKRQLMKSMSSNSNRFRDESFSGQGLQNFDVSGMSTDSPSRRNAYGIEAAGTVSVGRTPSHQRQQYNKDEFYREQNFEHNAGAPENNFSANNDRNFSSLSNRRYQDSNANMNTGDNRGNYTAQAYGDTSRSPYLNNLDNGKRNNMNNSNSFSMSQRFPDMADNRPQEPMTRNNRYVDQTNNRYLDNNDYDRNNGHGLRSSRSSQLEEMTTRNSFGDRNDAWGTNQNDSSPLGMNSYRNAPRQHHQNDRDGYRGQNQDRYRPSAYGRF
ncbi:SAFB-like transcription modulator isoform X2 [Uranotaenia lowii]|uniref:SAFB-like transcription modulator isoform X2 n=1 Tax=Uranotaenia lowii TaxID=190385 RepID=UPI002478B99E|nr:SAFB-like transcription modulator isoform X2 [Uranotaenia lowii]